MRKISYCPRCGNVRSRHFKYCECIDDVLFFNFKERKKGIFIETEHEIKAEYYNMDEPCYLDSITEADCLFFWENYIDIPENDKLNREAFEAQKEETLSFFAKGAHIITTADYATGSNSQKDASVIGRAAVGGVVAGPAGAVVGALSAIDKIIETRNNLI